MATRPYTGKYPHRIAQVIYDSKTRVLTLTSNEGETIRCNGRLVVDLKGPRMPKLGDDIRDYRFAALSCDEVTYEARLKAFDWFYEYSDDQSVWRHWRGEFIALRGLQPCLDPEGEIWNKYAPQEMRVKAAQALEAQQ
ncbi:MAG: hypothetical protein ACK4K3_07380 [Aquabacterium sp.]